MIIVLWGNVIRKWNPPDNRIKLQTIPCGKTYLIDKLVDQSGIGYGHLHLPQALWERVLLHPAQDQFTHVFIKLLSTVPIHDRTN